ncbi:hypothetical protein M0R45_000744 [Rubus argutus]|uniref:Uncharacterized protein n=1 Tax=Rubus argutus TaxID=59490 RepID=A0AAW1VS21_RUBAR
MLIKMVASDESGSLGYDQNGDDNAKPQPPPSQHQHGESSKQNSIFALTLDEIQSKSGKSFGSMNMDEFLANIWSVDENQVASEQPNQGDHEFNPANGKDTSFKAGLSFASRIVLHSYTTLQEKLWMRYGWRSTKLDHHHRLTT